VSKRSVCRHVGYVGRNTKSASRRPKLKELVKVPTCAYMPTWSISSKRARVGARVHHQGAGGTATLAANPQTALNYLRAVPGDSRPGAPLAQGSQLIPCSDLGGPHWRMCARARYTRRPMGVAYGR
jgi:hypothetical protein